MKEIRSFTIAELKTIFEGTSCSAMKEHEKDIDLYIQRGKDVEKQTLIANIFRDVIRPHTIYSIGFKATVSIKVFGKVYKSKPYDDEYLLTYKGYTYYFTGVEFNVRATDIEGYEIKVRIPQISTLSIKKYEDLDKYPDMIDRYIFIDPTESETDLAKQIDPSILLCENNIENRLCDINKNIKYIISRKDNYKNNFIRKCLNNISYFKSNIKNTPILQIEQKLTKSQIRKYGVEKAIDNFIYNEKKYNDRMNMYIDQLVCIMNIIKIDADTFDNILDYSPYKELKR